ncbi:MAG TPA: hypothetical protein VM282_04895 [Acidimicrobiales bacterium]|nr:hypothetical protein [Acidimicrobiales bacterium]
MNDPFEEQLRSTFRQVAQQTTTTHDLGMPPPSPRPSRSRRLIATGALSVLALVGVGALVVTRGDEPQTVRAAAGDSATAPETTVPSIGAALANVCANASGATSSSSAMQEMMDKLCAGGGLAAVNPLAACGIEAGAIRDLLSPLMADLEPLLAELKVVFAEFEPRIRAITDDPATKAKIELALPLLRARLEGLADPANRPDLSDPAVRQKLLDDLEAGMAPLANDAELKAKFEAIGNDLRARLEGLADTPDAQALKTKIEIFGTDPAFRTQAEALFEKVKDCKPR